MDFLPRRNIRQCRRCRVLVAGALPHRRALCSSCSKPMFATQSGAARGATYATDVIAERPGDPGIGAKASPAAQGVAGVVQVAARPELVPVRITGPAKEECTKLSGADWRFVFALSVTPSDRWRESWDAGASQRTTFAYVACDRIFLHCAPEKLEAEFELLKTAVDAANRRAADAAERETVFTILDSLSYP
jgi:hypothetical protein